MTQDTSSKYFNLDKFMVAPREVEEIKNNPLTEEVEYSTDTTKIKAYMLNEKLYIYDLEQI